MKTEHLIPKEVKESWGQGEWVDEPDIVEFEYGDMKCEIQRNDLGALCGYVHIPDYHKIYNFNCYGDDNFPEFDIHGGITFFEKNDNMCAIGFDCAHTWDIVPYNQKILEESRQRMKERMPWLYENEENSPFYKLSCYKNINFVIQECRRLVDQLNKIS